MKIIDAVFVEYAYQFDVEYFGRKSVRESYAKRGHEVPHFERDDYISNETPNWRRISENLYNVKGAEVVLGGETYTITEVDQKGGEGEGDEYYYVYKVNDKYYQLNAYYSSWEGVNWDDAELVEVTAKPITVISWVTA